MCLFTYVSACLDVIVVVCVDVYQRMSCGGDRSRWRFQSGCWQSEFCLETFGIWSHTQTLTHIVCYWTLNREYVVWSTVWYNWLVWDSDGYIHTWSVCVCLSLLDWCVCVSEVRSSADVCWDIQPWTLLAGILEAAGVCVSDLCKSSHYCCRCSSNMNKIK